MMRAGKIAALILAGIAALWLAQPGGWLDQTFTPYWVLAVTAVFILLLPVVGYSADYFRRRGGA